MGGSPKESFWLIFRVLPIDPIKEEIWREISKCLQCSPSLKIVRERKTSFLSIPKRPSAFYVNFPLFSGREQ